MPDPKPARFDPWDAGMVSSDEAPPRSKVSGDGAASRAPKPPSRPISDEWPRLDPEDLRSKPLDPDPAAHVRGYRFGLNFLLKRPPVLLKSTRSPNLFKNNYAEVLILTRSPLSFTRFKPAVQPWFFYELDPGVNI